VIGLSDLLIGVLKPNGFRLALFVERNLMFIKILLCCRFSNLSTG
jgi:hypothetical protein